VKISVIIPLGPKETSHPALVQGLVDQFKEADTELEIVLCVGKREDISQPKCVTVQSAFGRAVQLNAGAKAATGDFLWFLHADSRLTSSTVPSLLRSFRRNPDCLYFSRLNFRDDGPKLMKLNEWGVRLRAELLKMPFGDQGLALSRGLFRALGGYDTSAKYGEDHLLVWKARHRGISVRCTSGILTTSARKYRDGGWLAVTSRHLILTYSQAFTAFRRPRSTE
jgi:glycosyltransferase involved in cell wall biosynthesis